MTVDVAALEPFLPSGTEMLAFDLVAETVIFESEERLRAVLPELHWDDIESAASMGGYDLPDRETLPDPIPLALIVSVRNASGCEDQWEEGSLVFMLQVGQEAEQ